MKRYIEQLIEDLKEIAKNPPSPIYIEPPPHLDMSPITSELALVPFKTMEEWTGYETINFPESYTMNQEQIEQLNIALFAVFESLRVEIIDIPEEIPAEWIYETIISEWNHAIVQYLPSSGMDLEFCTGDWHSCPYGSYCDCYKEEEERKEFNDWMDKRKPKQ